MGSQDSKLVKLLTAAGWEHQVTPFYFGIKAPNRFARNIRLPQRPYLQAAMRVAGTLRLAGAGLRLLNIWRGGPAAAPALEATTEVVPRFGEFADELFAAHASGYALLGDRSSAALNAWYSEANPVLLRLLVKEAGQVVGWAVVLDTQMRGQKYFGDLRVGTLVDGFARPGRAELVVRAADRFMEQRGVDLVLSNQLHPEWCDALTGAGYRQGPSNFFFYYSRELAERLATQSDWPRRVHINRGDGDGPIHL